MSETIHTEVFEIVFKHYFDNGDKKIPVEEPLVVQYRTLIQDRVPAPTVVNAMLEKLRRAVIERVEK